MKRRDHFYDNIMGEKVAEYNEEILNRANRFMVSDMGKKTEEEVQDQYVKAYKGFYDNILENEMIRMRAVRMTNRIEEMSQFLATKRKEFKDGKEIEVGPKVKWTKLWGHDGQRDPLYKEARARKAEKLE